ncbi:MAG TPA: hypothetical protein VIJ41_01305 [Candidatus Nanopelagicales bacterium]
MGSPARSLDHRSPRTLRGESDQIAILDGQPVPGQIGPGVTRFGTWWRQLVTDPVDGHLLDYGRYRSDLI